MWAGDGDAAAPARVNRRTSAAWEEEVAATDDGPDEFKVLLAKQEVRIKELEGQVAEAAKTAEAADALRGAIEQVKARAADERAE